jgi:hypothetical protein
MSRIIAFGRNGELLVTDASHAYVQAFDRQTGNSSRGSAARAMTTPTWTSRKASPSTTQGNIFVADYDSGFVKKYDASING